MHPPDRDITPSSPHPILRSARDREALAIDASEGAEHAMRALAHELTGVIDACLRCIGRARAASERGPDPDAIALGAADGYLQAAETSLHEAALMVQATLRTGSLVGQPSTRSLSARRAPAEILAHATEVLMPLAEERSVHLTSAIAPGARDLPPLPIYPIVVNALRNAIEASPTDAEVHARLRLDADTPSRPPTLVLEITDEGPGPSEDDVFAPGVSTKAQGMGLGLSIAREIAHELEGTVSLRARDNAPGAIFVLSVPITKRVIG